MLNHLKNSVLKMKALTRLYTDSYGPMNSNYLRRSLDVVSGTLARYPRVYALRVAAFFKIVVAQSCFKQPLSAPARVSRAAPDLASRHR